MGPPFFQGGRGEEPLDLLRPNHETLWEPRRLAENVARRANRKVAESGRFFQGRFKSQQLLDEASILACAIHVDLNAIRAAVATTPEASHFTSAHERHRSRQRRARRERQARGECVGDEWLSPVEQAEKVRCPLTLFLLFF